MSHDFIYFDSAYRFLCQKLLNSDNVRNTREINNVHFTISDIETVTGTSRDIDIKYLMAELIWYLAGKNDMNFINNFASLWGRISDDGVTNNSAYGYIIQKKYGFDQMKKIIELLKTDPFSRRAVINLNAANENVIETKDEICTIALQFLLRNNRLNCTAVMRSNDIWFGLPYDIVFFTTVQKLIADALGVAYGTYSHFAGSLHVYDKDVEKIKKVLQKVPIKPITINHQVLYEKADELYKIVNRENIIDKCLETGVLG